MKTQPEITYIEQFVPQPEQLFRRILDETTWDERMHARLTASFGVPYNYSGMTYPEVSMPDFLQDVCDSLGEQIGFTPNNCLINNYVEGNSSMGFHSDSLAELEPGTGVAIVSLGEQRTLTFRRTEERSIRCAWPLPSGSLLYMPPEVQVEWQHAVLKQPGAGQRMSLTFRALK